MFEPNLVAFKLISIGTEQCGGIFITLVLHQVHLVSIVRFGPILEGKEQRAITEATLIVLLFCSCWHQQEPVSSRIFRPTQFRAQTPPISACARADLANRQPLTRKSHFI